MKKDRRAILRTPVRPLPVELRGIVILPEHFEQLVIRKLRGIVLDFDRFGMASAVGADVFIARIRGLPAGIADSGRAYARQLPESRLDSPKTACCKSSFSHK